MNAKPITEYTLQYCSYEIGQNWETIQKSNNLETLITRIIEIEHNLATVYFMIPIDKATIRARITESHNQNYGCCTELGLYRILHEAKLTYDE